MGCAHRSSEGQCPLCTSAAAEPADAATIDGSIAETSALQPPSAPGPDQLGKGSSIGRYLVREVIGEGGMGIIYTAYDPQLDRDIALKLLRSDSPRGAEESNGQARLLREAQAMAQLSHPNVLPVYDVGLHDGGVFVAMELVRGENLSQWLKARRHDWREIVDVFLQAGQGLFAAHQAGLIHRDFKPGNVLIGEDGRARVADFGIARSMRTAAGPRGPLSLDTPMTMPGLMLGSPGYMAPEQYAGVDTSPATDQFAFCIALYLALYGVRPFTGATLEEVAHATMLGRVPPAPKGSPVPAWIHRALEKGLAVDPAQRHDSMASLLFALRNDPARVVRQRAAVAAGVFALVAGGLAFGWFQQKQARVCRGAELKLAGVWDAERSARAAAAFEATGKSYAKLAWSSASAGLDDYAQRWVAARTETCEATRIRGEQTESQLQLRMTCLDRRLDELAALVGALGAADVSVVDQSASAVAHLSPLNGCSNVKGLEERRAVPPDAKPAFERVSQALAQGRAVVATGRFTQARAKIAPAVAEAMQLNLPGLQAEAYATLGLLERESSNWLAARDALEQAVRFAEAAADDETAAASLASLVSLVGWRLERPAEGRLLASLATGIVERMGGDERIEAALAESLGDAEWQAGESAQALVGYRRALAMLIRMQGHESIDVARLRSSVGWVLIEQGALKEGKVELEASRAIREKVLGGDHPTLASSWNELGTLAGKQGAYAQAVHCFERVLAVTLLAAGDDSTLTAKAKLLLADSLIAVERAAEGFALVRQAEATLARHPEALRSLRNLVPLVEADLEAAVGRHEHAVTLGRQLLPATESSLGKDHPNAAEVALVLARSLSALNRHAEALENFDRFLAKREQLGTREASYAIALADSSQPLLALGRTEQGLERLERAAALLAYEQGHPKATLVHFELARALWASGGDKARARSLAIEALAKHGEGEWAAQIRAWLARHESPALPRGSPP